MLAWASVTLRQARDRGFSQSNLNLLEYVGCRCGTDPPTIFYSTHILADVSFLGNACNMGNPWLNNLGQAL